MRHILSATVLTGVLLSSNGVRAEENYYALSEASVSGLRADGLEALCRSRDIKEAAYYILGVLDEAATRETSPLVICPGKRSLIDIRNLICGEVGGNLDDDKKKIPAAMVVSGVATVSMRCGDVTD